MYKIYLLIVLKLTEYDTEFDTEYVEIRSLIY
jgi:hypothetical protein